MDDQGLSVFDNKGKYEIDLRERIIDFVVKTLKFLATIPYKKEYDVFRIQLSKSSSSIGANYEESQATTSREFHAKIAICLREAKETNYWYRVLDRLDLGDNEKRKLLLQESSELKRIFGAIESKTRKRN